MSRLNDNDLLAYPTPSLKALIAAVALSDIVVTLDTGSLHISAALKKPTIALMTKAKEVSWYPWKTKSVVLSAENVKEIPVESVSNAIKGFLREFTHMGAK